MSSTSISPIMSYSDFFVHLNTYSDKTRTVVRYDELAGSIMDQVFTLSAKCTLVSFSFLFMMSITFYQQATVSAIQRFTKNFAGDSSGEFDSNKLESALFYRLLYSVQCSTFLFCFKDGYTLCFSRMCYFIC